MAVKKIIRYNAPKCTGCRLCMLACSWACNGEHSTSTSVIQVDVDEKVFARTMELDEARCSGCLACVSACPDGALEAESAGEKEAV